VLDADGVISAHDASAQQHHEPVRARMNMENSSSENRNRAQPSRDDPVTERNIRAAALHTLDSVAQALATLRAERLIITRRRTITIPSTDHLNLFADR